MKYNKMTDRDINLAVEEHEGLASWNIYDERTLSHDYCNNPADAWPIIVENEITLLRDISTDDVWQTISRVWFTEDGLESACNAYFIDANPLRAAMIVYLMMSKPTP